MQVTDGVFKVDGVRVANVYVVVTDDGLLLVDTGIPGSAGRICSFIEAMGRDLNEVRDIVLTHFDLEPCRQRGRAQGTHRRPRVDP